MSKKHDVHLGDVVVSQPGGRFGCVVQYDFGKIVSDGRFERTTTLSEPPRELLQSLQTLKEKHTMEGNRLPESLQSMLKKLGSRAGNFMSPGMKQDQLFDASYNHVSTDTDCDKYDSSKSPRGSRRREAPDPHIHYGTIASANQVMRDGQTRDQIAQDLGAICFEMEAAGLMNNFPCLVIRGICDYADTHKNKSWQGYAAATAAAFAKELLGVIPKQEVVKMRSACKFAFVFMRLLGRHTPSVARPQSHRPSLNAPLVSGCQN
jgi:nucleoside phosphorylase